MLLVPSITTLVSYEAGSGHWSIISPSSFKEGGARKLIVVSSSSSYAVCAAVLCSLWRCCCVCAACRFCEPSRDALLCASPDRAWAVYPSTQTARSLIIPTHCCSHLPNPSIRISSGFWAPGSYHSLTNACSMSPCGETYAWLWTIAAHRPSMLNSFRICCHSGTYPFLGKISFNHIQMSTSV